MHETVETEEEQQQVIMNWGYMVGAGEVRQMKFSTKIKIRH